MKILKILLLVVLIFGIIFYVGYTVIVPKMVSKTISTGDIPAIIPKKYHSQIKETREQVVEQVESLPQAMDEYKISYEDLYEFMQEIENKEVKAALEEINTKEISSPGPVFDIGLKHIAAELPSASKFRALFESRFTKEDIQEQLEKINTSDLPTSVEIDMARRIGLELLKEKKDEINRKLDSLQESR